MYQTNHIVHFAYSSYKQVIIYSIIDLGSVQYRKTDDIQNDNSNYSFEKRLCGSNFAHLLRRFDPAIKHNSPLANTHHIALNSFRGVRSPIAEGETIRLSLSRRHLGRMHTTLPEEAGTAGRRRSAIAGGIQRSTRILPPSRSFFPTLRGRQKETWESHEALPRRWDEEVDALRRAAPYFRRSQAALMRRIASTMFSSLVA